MLTSPPVRPEGSSSSAFEAPSLALLDGRLAASADGGNTVRIWDLEDRIRRLI